MDRRRRTGGWSDIGSTQLTDRSQVPWGAILFIAMEAMFFAALFTAYFYLRTRIPYGSRSSVKSRRGLVCPR